MTIEIRQARSQDRNDIWEIIKPVIRAGDTYTLPHNMSQEEGLDYWLSEEKTTFVAIIDEQIVGTYYIKTNQLGGGDHICNCGYISDAKARGKGLATAMCEHSLQFAKEAGYRGMQYNFVVSTNSGAIRLWKKFGFEIVGTLPSVFSHPDQGYVDAYVMFKSLIDRD